MNSLDLKCYNTTLGIVTLSEIASGSNTNYCIVSQNDIDSLKKNIDLLKENIVSEIYREMPPQNVIKKDDEVNSMNYGELMEYRKILNKELDDMPERHLSVIESLRKVKEQLSNRGFSGKTKKQKRILKKRKLKKQKSKKEKKILNKR
tara:strand:- start:1463 stop:1906 length:444 start_codon:yes stop_codon:yes gene_type:complete